LACILFDDRDLKNIDLNLTYSQYKKKLFYFHMNKRGNMAKPHPQFNCYPVVSEEEYQQNGTGV